MRRKIKKIDVNELIEADDINRTTIKGEMRKLWPAIHQKLTECGWTARDMVKWLDERGVSMSVELFRVYLRDLDREQGYDRSAKHFFKDQKKPNSLIAVESSPASAIGSVINTGRKASSNKTEQSYLKMGEEERNNAYSKEELISMANIEGLKDRKFKPQKPKGESK